ncbi:30S ribosomal protein S20 [Gammaproteobacteria bacterium]|nr:30S ribosomal protein S20 [Gammaproteobacteria bacterium]
MANSPQSRKRARQAVKKRLQNMSTRSMMRTELKKITALIELKDKGAAQTQLVVVTKVLDRLASKGLIHKNKAARHKSRLTHHIKSL